MIIVTKNKNVMKTLVLTRGVPGSGKSTTAKLFGGLHIEADMYFVDNETGEYRFDPTKLKNAHNWCQDVVENWMETEEPVITTSNTFTEEWEMKPYLEMAEKYGYRVVSLIVENRHGGINEHGVPEEKLEQMEARLRNNIKLR
jgi:predicted kinase